MNIGNYKFDFNKEAYIMGILNITPDSFSDGGRYHNLDAALYQTERMISEGASIIDIGGESTRPGFTPVTPEEEIERILPVVEGIVNRFDIPVSLDTYKAEVAKVGIKAGISMINDIWGLKADPLMAGVIADTGVACCLMHNRDNTDYNNFVKNVVHDMKQMIDQALNAGISKNKIILDPGVGFGKTYQQNLQIINNCDLLCELDFPVLLGTSRKSVIGLTLDVPTDERLNGTIATTVLGYMKGCRIFRVHDIKENAQALKMAKAIVEA